MNELPVDDQASVGSTVPVNRDEAAQDGGDARVLRSLRLYDSPEMRKYTQEYFYDDGIVRELDESGYSDSLYDN
jgi:hypothetical protein